MKAEKLLAKVEENSEAQNLQNFNSCSFGAFLPFLAIFSGDLCVLRLLLVSYKVTRGIIWVEGRVPEGF